MDESRRLITWVARLEPQQDGPRINMAVVHASETPVLSPSIPEVTSAPAAPEAQLAAGHFCLLPDHADWQMPKAVVQRQRGWTKSPEQVALEANLAKLIDELDNEIDQLSLRVEATLGGR